MRCNYKPEAEILPDTCIVQQEYKPFHLVLEDYINGNVEVPQTDEGSFQFSQEGDVDFGQPLDSGHHDIYQVASGQDPVFKDAVPVDPSSSSSSSEASLASSDTSSE